MADKKHYDVIIIGTGAGGGTLAYALAPTGKSILLIERGDYVRREKENWSSQAVNLEGRYNTHEVWQDKDGKALHPHTNYYVGGNTKFYGAALFRLREKDFGELRHHGGISPAWPISYDDMEPYYTAGGTASTTSTASAALIRPIHHQALLIRIRLWPTKSAFNICTKTSKPGASIRFPCRSASCSMKMIRAKVPASSAAHAMVFLA